MLAFVITHRADLDATKLYKTFRDKEDGFIKVVMRPARLIIRSTVRNLLV